VLDISDRKAMEDTLKYNSEHDSWTGLYNRNYLVSFLEKETKEKGGTKKALIGINLSSIQLFTINYGFQYTQNLIRKVAEALSRYCTDDRLLFQPREDRFIFYLQGYKDKNELVAFSKAIVETLEAIFVTDRIPGGIGILEIGQDQSNVDIDLLLRRLLIASEKSSNLFGKDFEFCFYDDELEALIDRERDIVEALNMIAAEDYTGDELYLQYQPVLDLRTGLVCGFEALARLNTEKLGFVSPAEFIPIAEETKLILPIGEKVIVKAFSFLNKLKANGYDEAGVSINISAIQLLSPGFAERLLDLVRMMQVNPGNIGIEITESVFACDFDRINNTIAGLREAGLRIAIDDFGTGYSSLAREEELAVDCIKVDKHFIDKLLYADLSKIITGDIISISHKLGHCTIAEGVEYEKQLRHLKEYGCDRVQGYLISKPLDEEDAIKFLRGTREVLF
ncbi:MAG: GGDEF domain-containing protein, partial [Clostridia bacterium]|nr:GGDEF domain-containing protein [Clostridia bacterium]